MVNRLFFPILAATAFCIASSPLIAESPANNSFQTAVHLVNEHSHVIVLSTDNNEAVIAVWPAMQGRVLTSSATGVSGHSFGWFNQTLIASGKTQQHINAVGGEDRLWLGPESGQFGLFFAPGAPYDLAHWYTPAPLDTEPFGIISETSNAIRFRKDFSVKNHSGTVFHVQIDRTVQILDSGAVWKDTGLAPMEGVKVVGFQSINTLTNTGSSAWQPKTGLLSIWILGQFEANPTAVIILPIRQGPESKRGVPVITNYFGSVPASRIEITPSVVLFRADSHYRSKLGLTPQRARGILGSYDSLNHVLTIIQYNHPQGPARYVNSLWKDQKHPYRGTVANCYNDGPPSAGAPQLGHFYEMESSSPAAGLQPHQSIEHTQRTLHFVGSPQALDELSRTLLGVSLKEVEVFAHRPPTQ